MSLLTLGYKNLWLPLGLSLDWGEAVLWAAQRRVPNIKELNSPTKCHVSKLGNKSSWETLMRHPEFKPLAPQFLTSRKCVEQEMLFYIYFLKKEWTADIYNNMDDLKSIIISEKKARHKRVRTEWLHLCEVLEVRQMYARNPSRYCLCSGGGDWLKRGTRVSEMHCILICEVRVACIHLSKLTE